MTTLIEARDSAQAMALLAWLVVSMGAYIGFDLSQRAIVGRAYDNLRWLVCAAIGLGTGLWAAMAIQLAALPPRLMLGYHPGDIAGVWLMTLALAGAALLIASGRPVTRPRVIAAGLLLGLAAIFTQVGTLLSLGLKPGIVWREFEFALAAIVATGGALLAIAMVFVLRERHGHPLIAWQLPAALLFGAFIVGSQQLVVFAADLPHQTLSMWAARLPAAAVTALAVIGALVLLPVMLLTTSLEAQMRASLRQARGVLHRHALTDLLTSLPNRQAFELEIDQATVRADREQERLALFFVDLDGFKPINESFGHADGDKILREIGARLQSALPAEAIVARLGGDQFLVLLTGDPRPSDAARRAADVQAAISAPVRVDGREASIGCSIGIAMYPEHGTAGALITHADAAMRACKSQGGATWCFFEPRMASGAREQVELLRDLRRALAEGQLELYYQPKVHAPSGQITGVEALVRWHHPTRGMVSPSIFIPIAERFGLIGALGDWVIDDSCRQIGAWRAEGLRMRVSINLSVHQLRQGSLSRHLQRALQRHGIQPQLLTVELTESVAMDDADGTIRTIEALNALGVHISIDDFGTGHSSLSYLRRLNVGELKIDRSFVFDLESSRDARAIVDAIVRLAQALGLKVVAEGVETEAQSAILRMLGCDELQGFLYAKPMSARSLALWATNAEGPTALDFRASLFADDLAATL